MSRIQPLTLTRIDAARGDLDALCRLYAELIGFDPRFDDDEDSPVTAEGLFTYLQGFVRLALTDQAREPTETAPMH